MVIRFKGYHVGAGGGAYFRGDRAAFAAEVEAGLVTDRVAEYVTTPPVAKPASAGIAVVKAKKEAMARKIAELGGVAPHMNSGLDKFETALRAAQESAGDGD